MNESQIINMLTEYFCSMGCDVAPETWRVNCGSLWMSGGGGEVKRYIDGSSLAEVPFEIRLRTPARSIKDRINVYGYYDAVRDGIRAEPLLEGYGAYSAGEVRCVSGASKSAVYENGEEEYRAAYVFRFRLDGDSE